LWEEGEGGETGEGEGMETRYTNLSQILMYHVHMNTKEYKKVDITELQIVSKFTLRELYEVNYAPINSYVSSF